MELKSPMVEKSSTATPVLIVPLWNWNVIRGHKCLFGASSNRTFMELKCSKYTELAAIKAVLIVPLWNWNATIHRRCSYGYEVLIVPLWNWNKKEKTIPHVLNGSNRTFMELKFFDPKTGTFKDYSSNRTFMELKFKFSRTWNRTIFRSNRTFMELKWIILKWILFWLSVLIVPLWNWNDLSLLTLKLANCSNRTFMELK